MSADSVRDNVIQFPRMPMRYIRDLVGLCPALQPIMERLQDVEPGFRSGCEDGLAELMGRTFYLPQISGDDAASLLEHASAREEVTEEELGLLACDSERREFYFVWQQVWEKRDEERVREWIRYFAALMARLYRFEYRIRHEAAMTER